MTNGTTHLLTDDERMIYAEAGQWVRLTNTISWALAAFLVPLLITPIFTALTTPINRCLLFIGSFLIAMFWIHFESLYQKGTDQTRAMLEDMERRTTFPQWKIYTGQKEIVPNGKLSRLKIKQFLWIFYILLALMWIWLLFLLQPTFL
jgi:hypothetical protein